MKTVRPRTKEGARSKVNYVLAVVKRHVATESTQNIGFMYVCV